MTYVFNKFNDDNPNNIRLFYKILHNDSDKLIQDNIELFNNWEYLINLPWDKLHYIYKLIRTKYKLDEYNKPFYKKMRIFILSINKRYSKIMTYINKHGIDLYLGKELQRYYGTNMFITLINLDYIDNINIFNEIINRLSDTELLQNTKLIQKIFSRYFTSQIFDRVIKISPLKKEYLIGNFDRSLQYCFLNNIIIPNECYQIILQTNISIPYCSLINYNENIPKFNIFPIARSYTYNIFSEIQTNYCTKFIINWDIIDNICKSNINLILYEKDPLTLISNLISYSSFNHFAFNKYRLHNVMSLLQLLLSKISVSTVFFNFDITIPLINIFISRGIFVYCIPWRLSNFRSKTDTRDFFSYRFICERLLDKHRQKDCFPHHCRHQSNTGILRIRPYPDIIWEKRQFRPDTWIIRRHQT